MGSPPGPRPGVFVPKVVLVAFDQFRIRIHDGVPITAVTTPTDSIVHVLHIMQNTPIYFETSKKNSFYARNFDLVKNDSLPINMDMYRRVFSQSKFQPLIESIK